MSWSQTVSWALLFGGVAAIIIGLFSRRRSHSERFSHRRVFVTTGAILIVASGVLFVAVIIFRSFRSMPV